MPVWNRQEGHSAIQALGRKTFILNRKFQWAAWDNFNVLSMLQRLFAFIDRLTTSHFSVGMIRKHFDRLCTGSLSVSLCSNIQSPQLIPGSLCRRTRWPPILFSTCADQLIPMRGPTHFIAILSSASHYEEVILTSQPKGGGACSFSVFSFGD